MSLYAVAHHRLETAVTDSTRAHQAAPQEPSGEHTPRPSRRTQDASREVHYDARRYPHPRTQQRRLERAVLEQLNRHRLLRAVDLAAAIAPERPFDAAMSSVQRQLARLIRERCVQRAVIAHITCYALTARGAYRLSEYRAADAEHPPAPWTRWSEVRPGARRLGDRANPEHTLRIAHVVIAAEARGFPAWTESELRTLLQQPPLVIEGESGKRGLWPDALLLIVTGSGTQLCWVEIDRSRRGSQRLADLAALVRSAGQPVRVPHPLESLPLRRITVLTSTPSIARADVTHLRQHVTVGFAGDSAIVERDEGLFDVHVDVEQRLADGRTQIVKQTGARLVVRPWTEPTAITWFESQALPWRVPSGAWPPARGLRFSAAMN